MYGKLGVGITSIDPEVQVDVAGAIKSQAEIFSVPGYTQTWFLSARETIWIQSQHQKM